MGSYITTGEAERLAEEDSQGEAWQKQPAGSSSPPAGRGCLSQNLSEVSDEDQADHDCDVPVSCGAVVMPWRGTCRRHPRRRLGGQD